MKENNLGIAGRITALFQNNHLTPLLAIAMVLAGIFALVFTPREEEPQIDVTMARIMVPWPGATAQEVEQIISAPGERVLSRIEGTEHVGASSVAGMAVLTVQFKVGVPRSEALIRLHDTLRTQSSWLPAGMGIGQPDIEARGVDDVPILALSLHAPLASAHELQQLARSLESDLKRVPGTRDVWRIGGADELLRIDLDPERMQAAGVGIEQIIAAIGQANSSAHAGMRLSANQSLLVDAGQFLRDPAEIANLLIAGHNSQSVRLGEIADIRRASGPATQYVSHRAKDSAQEIHAAITLAITKKPGENAIAVADALLERVQELRNTLIPDDIQLSVTRNYGQTADAKARTLIYKLIFATLSVVLLVLLALGWREAIVVGLAVGLTLAATLFASWAWGFTLNRVSLFALIFSIGILVDDAIVVVENIHRHQRLHPERPALKRLPIAVDEVGGPTILATFTVIAALLPMAFVSGLMGPYMSPIPINASMGMLISLGIALTFTPWLAMRMGSKAHAGTTDQQSSFAAKFFQRIMGAFLLGARARSRRYLLLFATLALVAASALLPAAGLVELKMLPFDNKSEFQVLVKMPPDTPLEQTNALLQELATVLLEQPELEHLQTYAGSAAPINFNGLVRQYDLRRDPALGDIQVNLVDKSKRAEQSHAIAMRLRPALQAIAQARGAELQVVEVPPGPPVMAPIVAEIYGPDAAGRAALAKLVRGEFAATDGMVDISDSTEAAAPRLILAIDRERAASAGVAQDSIVQSLQAGLGGLNIGVLRDGQSIPTAISLRLPDAEQGGLARVLQLPVLNKQGQAIAIGELVYEINTSRNPPLYRKDLLPMDFVNADMAGAIDSPLYGMFAARARILQHSAPDGQAIKEYFTQAPENPYAAYAIKWDGEWQITYETFRDMGLAYAVGLLLIYLLVVAHFGSYLMPLIIMAPIPLTIIGVMPGHALLDKQFTATSMIGMIALAGIIVRNSILLLDFILLRLRAGADFAQAVIESAAVRAQPILLTGLAATLGAFFILDDPIFNGLAIALIFGIAVSTVLTLLVIPVLVFAAYHKDPQALINQGAQS